MDIVRDVPGVLGRYREHVYADDKPVGGAHRKMGFETEGDGRGHVVVVRPDGYVGCVVDLVEGDGTVEALNEYFSSFCTKKLGGSTWRL